MDILIDKAKDQSRIIAIGSTPRHIAWQSLKCGIFISLAYTLPATSFSKVDGDQIASALYILPLPNFGGNRNFPKPLTYVPGRFLGLGIPHPYQ